MDELISISDKILHLRKIRVFEGLMVGDLAAIAAIARERRVESGEVVIREGDPGNMLYLVLDGKVAVVKGLFKGEGDGRQGLELARIEAGDYFGEMALFENTTRSASIKAVEDCRFLTLEQNEFSEIVREFPQIALLICRAFCVRIRELHQVIDSIEQSCRL